MKLLVDMNLSPGWVDLFAREGIEAVHWATIGMATALDSEIMSYARHHGYVVLTHDLDFSAMLAATNGEKPSVVQIRADDVSPFFIGMAVIRALGQLRQELESGALLTVEPSRTRARLLPLRR